MKAYSNFSGGEVLTIVFRKLLEQGYILYLMTKFARPQCRRKLVDFTPQTMIRSSSFPADAA